jgi:glutathione synthase/RimK-type ligase-like ATP-grasp enzyme
MSFKPIAIYYEHPEWFKPLFAELDRRGLPYVRVAADQHEFDPSEDEAPYSLVVNRMSSSAYMRGHVQGIFYTHGYLAHLERLSVPVINGLPATQIETSKARQLTLLKSLGISYPKSYVVNHPSQILKVAEKLRFPLMVKANIGGAGAGIVKFNDYESLKSTVEANQIDLGIDYTALVQEFAPTRGGHIVRVETLNKKFLYAMKVYTTGDSFNLCPAEVCQIPEAPASGDACIIEATKKGIKVEAYTPPAEIIATVERIAEAAKMDVGGVEYLIDDRDGSVLFYDINALSNFVANAVEVIGFDPYVNFVDYLEHRLQSTQVAAVTAL